jgi:hypothetical protein
MQSRYNIIPMKIIESFDYAKPHLHCIEEERFEIDRAF